MLLEFPAKQLLAIVLFFVLLIVVIIIAIIVIAILTGKLTELKDIFKMFKRNMTDDPDQDRYPTNKQKKTKSAQDGDGQDGIL